MHDPMTQIVSIKYPWFAKGHKPWPKRLRARARSLGHEHVWKHDMTDQERSRCSVYWPQGYRDEFAIIWHRDPEKDGSERSCSNRRHRLTEMQMAHLDSIAWDEGRHPYFTRRRAKTWSGDRIEAEAMLRALYLRVASVLGVRMTYDHACVMAAMRIHKSDCVSPCSWFVYMPGYHSNGDEDTPEKRQEYFRRILGTIAHLIQDDRMPWWRSNRWHVHHWRFSVRPLQRIQRLIFDRCEHCGKRFRRDDEVVSTCWDRPDRGWFGSMAFWRSETNLRHMRCSDVPKPQVKGADVAAKETP